MNFHLSCLWALALIVVSGACGRAADSGTAPSSESGESSGESESAESGVPMSTPCEERSQDDCFGLVTQGDEYADSCVWTELTPLADAGNSCAMDAPVGHCLPIAPVLDGCGGPPELTCTLGDTTEYGTAAVKEIDGQLYILDFGYDCWPPGNMQICEGSDLDPVGCDCACDLILGG